MAKWAALTIYAAGALIRQLTAPAVGSERVFVCIVAGTSLAAEPASWTITRGGKTAETAGPTWQECTGIAGINGDHGGGCTAATSAATASGAVLTFSAVPANISVGLRVQDKTTQGVIPANTTVLSFTSTTVTMSASVTGGGVGSGDNIGFSNTPSWIDIKNTAVTLGQVIQRNNCASLQICTTAGNSGNGAEPSFSDTAGTTTADNTVTWTSLGVVGGFTGWQAPHARLANAYASTWGQAGNSFFVASEHAETQSTALTATSPGTAVSPSPVYCVTKTAVPPSSANLTTGATLTTTGASALTINGTGFLIDGIAFLCASSGTPNLTFGNSGGSFAKLRNGALQMGSASNQTLVLGTTNGNVELENTTYQVAGAGTVMAAAGDVVWKKTLSAVTGATIPTSLFAGTSSNKSALIQGVDLSALGSGKTLVSGGGANGWWAFLDCKLGSSVTVAGTLTGPYSTIDVIRGDSVATNYVQRRIRYAGSLSEETTIVRTGGATDGGTPISWKIVTTANSKFINPFISFPIGIWNPGTSSLTVTMYGIWGGAVVPNNDDIWIEADYLGSALTPLGTFIDDTKANNLASGSALASDSSTWGGSTTAFKMTLTFTPAMAGPINLVIKAAKATSTFYVDPKPVITGLAEGYSYILAPGVYTTQVGLAARLVGGSHG